MSKHKWKFKAHFRREAYGWKGTSLAAKRMREAVSEIKKTAKKDSALGGEATVELFVRLYPALMNIDGSSGSLGRAMNKTIDALVPVLIGAEWDMNTRGRWLDKLFEAIQEDGWGTFDDLRDRWGELCVYVELANLWADRLIPLVKSIFTDEAFSYSVATDMCLSCLLYTERYEELYELLELNKRPFWPHNKFRALGLVQQGKYQEALDYAEDMLSQDKTGNEKDEIDEFCESVLIIMGRSTEAYQEYGLNIPCYGTYLNIYRSICKKYPMIDNKQILLNCVERTAEKGKWFAAAKSEGFLDIAWECAQSSGANPETLLRASRDYAEKDIDFSLRVGVRAIILLMTETFYEDVTAQDVIFGYQNIEDIARDRNRLDDFQEMLGRDILKRSCKPNLRAAVLDRLKRM